ncbi:DNA-binding IclR family transcriptional regulator [Amycolatopsis bartoniae]|uniref:IclR family transcriptional regulator n=1 Tax=Amycolatopsis bartoniae TaxID=941986 RepID=A0A8H9MG33_9PSEU|nr:IclR family transcriptional regulator [Amycolatopsis bartoniae]MBB2935566.1 DNA-binding IclR family transcriptional regulator [Amycolatopsis bartoniae]TVT05249.1 IclR family transcriptional regulator [Amycolatopsis bartoniae]GHF76811.1 IclR family transcriptional regulator [Amycolatopsis bartoniae]
MCDTAAVAVHTRILSVLAAFSSERPNLTLSEISRATGLPKGTAHRIVTQLVTWGALERDERHYVIGLRMFEIGALAPRAYRHRARILPFLEEAASATGAEVMLAVLDKDEAVLVEHLGGRRAVALAAGLGERLPLHASGVGHVMMAFGPGELLNVVCARPLPPVTSHTITDASALRAAVARVREAGVSVLPHSMLAGTVSVAAPIFAERGAFAGAILFVCPVARTNVKRLSKTALQTAHRISAALGS